MNKRRPAPWAPSEPEADLIIVRHAPRLARDLRIEVDPDTIALANLCDDIARVVAASGVRADEAAWSLCRAFG